MVRGDDALNAAFEASDENLLPHVLKHESFANAFRKFIDTFGYRGPSEWDLGSDSWDTAPHLVLALIDRLRTQDDHEGPTTRQAGQSEDTQSALEEALARLPHDAATQQQFHAALDSARRFGSWRERGRHRASGAILTGRQRVSRGGSRPCAHRDVDGQDSGFRTRGDSRGPQTDPSWTPLFTVAAGVVVDVGSMSSHAMIVSRELGIPCAAGGTDASRRIPSGSLVEVDGSTGTVTVISE